jgi:hypothetical protein
MISSFKMSFMAFGFASLVGCATMHEPLKPKIESQSYLIPSSDAGIQLKQSTRVLFLR